MRETLFFGAGTPTGTVSAEQWQRFVETELAPRFPAGFSWWSGHGQWLSAHGTIEREASFIVDIAHVDRPVDQQAIQATIDAYRQTHAQEAVLRLRQPTCLSLGSTD